MKKHYFNSKLFVDKSIEYILSRINDPHLTVTGLCNLVDAYISLCLFESKRNEEWIKANNPQAYIAFTALKLEINNNVNL